MKFAKGVAGALLTLASSDPVSCKLDASPPNTSILFSDRSGILSKMATQTATKTRPSQMQACQIVEYNKPFQIRTIPTPSKNDLLPDYVLLKIAVCGLCHTDLEYLKGILPLQLPVTASHEGTGTVVALGSNVTQFQIGDRVLAGQTFGRCGQCEICHGPEEYRHFCKNRDCMMTFNGRNGAFQEYLAIDAREAVIIPDKMSFSTATPLACAGTAAWRAVKQTRLKPGQWIGIVGSGGGLGHLAIQFARKVWGLRVVGVDARDAALDLSREAGADLVVDARAGKESMVEEVFKATVQGCDATIELSGHPTAVDSSAAMTKQHGQVIQVAVVSISVLSPLLLYWDQSS